ncbi:MAG: hypothetical protein IT186_26515 [Acidobacteria bacterium]|nr:hypothetical protein [Acidobacteriota bacterium]
MTRTLSLDEEPDFDDVIVLLSLSAPAKPAPESLGRRLKERMENSQHESEWVFRIVSRPADVVSVLDLKPPEGNRARGEAPLGRFFWDRERHRGSFFCWHLPSARSYALWIHSGNQHFRAGFLNRDPEGDGELPFIEVPSGVESISAITLIDVATEEVVLSGTAR